MTSCPCCSAENSDSSKFCSECGAALSPEFAATVTPETSAYAEGSSLPPSLSESSHHGRFLPGAKVADRYRIVSLVGKGGMGEVYRADDLRLGHTVALKFLPRDLAEDPQRLDYFHSEVRLTRQISHPNVCRVYDIGEVDGQHFLSMEYIDGEDLRILLRRIGRLPKDKAVQTARQLCAGLAAAHDRGVLHRDLKPANIMLDGHGQVRITDFGLAKLSDEGSEGEVAGTPAYMAPEQLSRGEATVQSDLYSLGLVLFEIFTGEAVYKKHSIADLKQAHEASTPSQPLQLVDDMDPLVEQVILRCLEHDPRLRLRSAAAVAASLPGGDPIAAALAAGETPSPEMVAASGESGALSFKAGTALVVSAVVMAILGVLLSDWLDPLGLNEWNSQKPEIFEDAARSISSTLAGDVVSDPAQNMVDSAWGFERRNGTSTSHAEIFWYREADAPLVPHPPNLMALPFMWDVTSANPPSAPGMVNIKLDSSGALVEFLRVERQRVGGHEFGATESLGETEIGAPEREAFQFSKLELDDFEPLEDTKSIPWPPPVFADAVSVWKMKDAVADESPLVMIGVSAGRLVYFRRFGLAESKQVVSHQMATSGRFDSRGNLFLLVARGFLDSTRFAKSEGRSR